MTEFKMPSLGADMEYGYLVEWFVKPGDTVSRGDIIADIETEKGVFAIEVFMDGVVEQILVEAGREQLPVGIPLALIHEDGEAIDIITPVANTVAANGETHAATVSRSTDVYATPLARNVARGLDIDLHDCTGSGPRGMITKSDVQQVAKHADMPSTQSSRARISPAARRLAQKLKVDIAEIKGTGPGGAITLADIESVALLQDSKPISKPPMSQKANHFADGMRQAIARAMTKSNAEIPHYYLETSVDMTHAIAWLERENQERSIRERIIMPVVLLKAVAKALEAVPELNGFWVNNHLDKRENIHVGFAIAMRGSGLITPAIHNVNHKTASELMADLSDLIKRTRSGKLRSSEMMDATITVTNLGDLGVETVFGVIYPPQVALVGLGKVIEMPWAEDGMIGVRPIMKATLAADHRATDGRIGGMFLDVLRKSLQKVDELWS